MDNLLSYYGLADARISTSEKDLPVNSRFVKKYVMNSLTDIIEDVVDGHLDQNTNEDSLHSNDSVNSRESAGGNNSTPKLNGNVIKTTVTSVSSHLAVIAKTYTKRHSSSNLRYFIKGY